MLVEGALHLGDATLLNMPKDKRVSFLSMQSLLLLYMQATGWFHGQIESEMAVDLALHLNQATLLHACNAIIAVAV